MNHMNRLCFKKWWPDSRKVTMWTSKNRGRYDRRKLRYPSDLTDDEWMLVELLSRPAIARPMNGPAAGY